MNAPPRIGFLGRTFGWTGSRQEWLTAAGLVAWLAVGVALTRAAPRLAAGEVLLAYAGWLLLIGVAARDAVRNLFGPVFFYDLVRVGRQRLTFGLRLGYVCLVGGVLLLMYFAWLDQRAGHTRDGSLVVGTNELSRFGTDFFETFVVIQFLAVALLTPVYVAGTISLEKERKTLEFLLATDLQNREIVFGKLASRVVNLLMFVLLGLPILAFIQLFGGVDPALLLMAVTATVVTVIGLAAVSIWYSTMMKKARDAIMLTYLSYVAYALGTFLAAAFTNFARIPGWWNTPVNLGFATVGVNDVLWRLADGNILWQVVLLEESAGRRTGMALTAADLLTRYVGFWAVASTLLLGHAVLRLRTVALQQAYGPTGGTRSRKKAVETSAGTAKVVVNESTRAYPPVGDNPVFWKEVFVDAGGRRSWPVRVIAGIIIALLMAPLGIMVYDHFFDDYGSGRSWSRFLRDVNGWVRVVTGILTGLLLLAAVVRGAGAISGEKDKDSWVSLLSTPLSADQILTGKWWGCVLGLRGMFLLLVVVWSIGLAFGAVTPALVFLAVPLVLLYTAAFSWLGLFFSMTARNTMVATVQAFFAGLFCLGGYWLVFLLCCLLPLSMADVREREYVWFMQILLSLSPPFLSGWLPMLSGDNRDLGPLSPDEPNGIGWLAPILAVLLWVGFTLGLAVACRVRFRRLTNREPQELPGLRPKPAAKTNPYE